KTYIRCLSLVTFDANLTVAEDDEPWSLNAMINNVTVGGTFRVLCITDSHRTFVRTFYVRAQNPTVEQAKNYIGSSPWYRRRVAVKESGTQNYRSYLNFNEIHAWAGDDPGPNHATDKRYTVNESFDGGMGMYQLTNERPTAEQSWNWMSNCDEGVRRLEECMQGGEDELARIRQVAAIESMPFPAPPIPEETIPEETINGITFTETGANSYAVAIGLKRFNGASCGYTVCNNSGCDKNGVGCTGQYLQWVSPEKTPPLDSPEERGHWAFCRVGKAGPYCNRYVRDVCNVASQD
ncbi:MAG: hypothetical protein GX117_06660, partial [Candidatus Hydrogenedentes bacterium]|nr:hypothetical protein [Candidatus Hydrogenedentota bacterium]